MSQTVKDTPPTQNTSRRNLLISWVAVAVLFVACLYLLFSRNKIASEHNIALEHSQRIIDSVKTNRLYLQADFDAASAKIDQLMSINAKLEDTLQQDKVAMTELRTRIKKILDDKNAAQSDLMQARDMLFLLTGMAQTYQAYIAELERDNTILTGENKLLAGERDKTVEKNIALKMTGSVLHASGIQIRLVHIRRSGKEKETSNARKADKIQITFDIDENRVAESGTKQVYVRLITPENKVLYARDVSGVLTTVEGNEIQYSMLKEVDLVKNQPLKGVIVEWPHTDTYTRGAYKVELYNLGYKIGESVAGLR